MAKERIYQAVQSVAETTGKLASKKTFRRPPETRTGLIFRSERFHSLTDTIGHALTKELIVNGTENLSTVRHLLEEEKRVVFASRHESHLDAVALDQSLEKAGFSDISDKVFHVFGIRLEKGVFSSWFAESQNRIRLWPPFDEAVTPEQKQLKSELDQSSKQAAKDALDNGFVVNIFPEGTRADKSRKMMKPIGAVEQFFEYIDADYIVPVAIDGTQNILASNKSSEPEQSKKRGVFPKRGSYSVTYCEPIDFKLLLEKHADKKYKVRRDAVMYDIMKPIADVLPPERRGYFQSHSE